MSRYRKVDPRIWNDKKFRALSDNGKLAFFFLLTHPHMTALGAMRATIPGLAAEIGWNTDAMSDAITHAISLGMVEASQEASYIALPGFLKYNEPEGPNSVIKAWPAALDLIPECREKSLLASRAKDYLIEKGEQFFGRSDTKAMWDAIEDAIRDGKRDPSPIQEQEQEQEQEKKLTPPTPRKRGGCAGNITPDPEGFEKFWAAYPKKVGKGAAERAWAKLGRNAELAEKILQAVKQARLSVEWQREGGRFIPNPATWLNEKRWEDALQVAAYAEREQLVFAAYGEILSEGKGWPEAVMDPFSPERSVAIREFLTFSPKENWVREYMRWLAEALDAKAGFGFDWVISREAYLRAREGNFAKLREAA